MAQSGQGYSDEDIMLIPLALAPLLLIPVINIALASPAPGSALDELGLSEEIKEELRNIIRKSKQISLDEDAEEFSDYETARQTLGGLEQCETTGFETRTREECEEVSETECKPITVTKYRTEIVNKCEVKTDSKKCNVTYSGVPRQKCLPKTVTKCDIDFEIVEESVYEEQCHVHVQHLCEEYISVPVHVPVPIVQKYDNSHSYRDKVVLDQITQPEPLFSVPPHAPSPSYERPAQFRAKRAAGEADELQSQVEDIVREMLMKVKLSKALKKASKSKTSEESISLLTDSSLARDPSLLGAPLILPVSKDEKHQTHPEVHPLPNLIVRPPPPPPPHPPHPSVVATFELPPHHPGCRSIATKTCEKIPRIIAKKIPHEICKRVPDIECFNVIKEVPELECVPEPYEECGDVAKNIPYLEPAEECEEIFYDDCIEVCFLLFIVAAVRHSSNSRFLRKFPSNFARERGLMRRQCSWRKVKFSEKKEKKEERRLETGRPLKVIFAPIITEKKSKVSTHFTSQ